MKMDTKRYENLKKEVKRFHSYGLQESYRRQGLSDKRYRWDLFFKTYRVGDLDLRKYYKDLNDDHIDTALRRIMREINS